MVKEKTHKLILKRRINKSPFSTSEGDFYFPTILTYGLSGDKKVKAMKLIIKTGQKNEPLPKGNIFEVEVKLKSLKGEKKMNCKNCGHPLFCDETGQPVYYPNTGITKNNPEGEIHYNHHNGQIKCKRMTKGKWCGCTKPEPKGAK